MSSNGTSAIRELLSDVLIPARSALLHGVLDDYADKIALDSAAQVMAGNVSQADSLVEWVTGAHRDMPYSITSPDDGSSAQKPRSLESSSAAIVNIVTAVPDDAFTHALAEIGIVGGHGIGKPAVLRVLKESYYALKPKGFAIIMYLNTSTIETVVRKVLLSIGREHEVEAGSDGEGLGREQLIDFAEQAQFERGKIRWSERKVALRGDQRDQIISVLSTRLKETLGSEGKNEDWSEAVEAAMTEVGSERGLIFEAQLLLAMKWDLLCA